jgi:hypothetical protein
MEKRALALDITPPGLIGDRSFRKRYKNEWAKVRTRRFAAGDFRCECCGDERGQARRLDGHEVYEFPDAETVRLERVWFLCRLCHDAVHLERTRRRCGSKYVAEVEAHYRRVNGGLSEENLAADFAVAMLAGRALWDQYGGPAATPVVDYGPLQQFADAFEARRRLREGDGDAEDFERWQITNARLISA